MNHLSKMPGNSLTRLLNHEKTKKGGNNED